MLLKWPSGRADLLSCPLRIQIPRKSGAEIFSDARRVTPEFLVRDPPRPFAGSRQTAYTRSLLRSKCARKARRGAIPFRVVEHRRASIDPTARGSVPDLRAAHETAARVLPRPVRAKVRRRARARVVARLRIFWLRRGKTMSRTAASRARRAADARDCVVVDGIASPRVAAHPSYSPPRVARACRPSYRARGASSRRASSTGVFENAPCGEIPTPNVHFPRRRRAARVSGGTSPASRDVSRTLASATHPPRASAHSIHPRARPPPAWWTRRGHPEPDADRQISFPPPSQAFLSSSPRAVARERPPSFRAKPLP